MAIEKRNCGLSAEDLRARTIQKAASFASFWGKKKHGERQEASQFEKEFLEIFSLNFRDARLEHKIKGSDGKIRYVDLFWPGEILVEMKSSGSEEFKGDEANTQAFDYVSAIERAADTPKVVMVSDFNTIRLFDLRNSMEDGRWNGVRPTPHEFPLSELSKEKNFALLQFLIGREDLFCHGQLEVNQEAAEEIGKLFSRLTEKKYAEHDCTVFLMRVLFCLFAEDTHIFSDNAFAEFILESIDHGQSIAGRLGQLFETLDTKVEDRADLPCPWDNSKPDPVLSFPYVDGGLFHEKIRTPPISDAEAKELIVENCSTMDWSKVSPAIFGSLFQSIRTREERRQLGEHYTSIENIEKVLNPLFLDALNEEYQSIVNSLSGKKKSQLKEFQAKLGKLQLLDPACGCGNFLIVAYERLRSLEYRVIRELYTNSDGEVQVALEASLVRAVRLSQLHGIEIDLFPQMIAMTAAWLQDHLANERLSALIGKHVSTIPLSDVAHIIHGNALQLDWETCFEDMGERHFDYIFGNPPFVGATMMTAEQKNEAVQIFGKIKLSNSIDYVGAWFCKAASYMGRYQTTRSAFVATNSITQGEQPSALWKPLFSQYPALHFDFAWKTFKWDNEAKGKASVHCIILGFSVGENIKKQIFSQDNQESVGEINEYITPLPMVFIESRSKPISGVEKIRLGNKPSDGGHLILTEKEKNEIESNEPNIKKYIKKYIGAEEFINNTTRYCLWLLDVNPNDVRKSKVLQEKLENVRKFRLNSSAKPTREKAQTPHLFFYISQPQTDYLLIPSTSSERREYVPIGFIDGKEIIASNAAEIIPNANLYHFAILTSSIHMTWMRTVAGRLEMRYRYSNNIVYNNFPWPDKPKDTSKIETLAQAVLDARAAHPGSCLADLYDPLAMPDNLRRAHKNLDKAILRLYGLKSGATDTEMLTVLFAKYKDLTAGK